MVPGRRFHLEDLSLCLGDLPESKSQSCTIHTCGLFVHMVCTPIRNNGGNSALSAEKSAIGGETFWMRIVNVFWEARHGRHTGPTHMNAERLSCALDDDDIGFLFCIAHNTHAQHLESIA